MAEPTETKSDEMENVGSVAIAALKGLADNIFSASVVGPALSQIGLTLGDQAKLFRVRNLIRISNKLEQILDEKGLDVDHLRKVSLAVGLPLLERASYQDDEVLQQMWANLLASAVSGNGADEQFSLDITHVEILHQLSRLDCEVLKFIVENGFRGRDRDDFLILQPLDPLKIRNEFTPSLAHLAVEKLVSLGCAYRVVRTPLSTKSGDGYGPIAHDIIATLIGANLYIAASGNMPAWNECIVDDEDQVTA